MSEIVTIGQATLYHGDCREILPGLEYESVISDPPYGIGLALGVCSKGSNGGMWANVKIVGDETVGVRDEMLALISDAKSAAIFASHRAPQPPGFSERLIWEKGEHTGAGNLAFPWKPNFELIWVRGEWSGKRIGAVIKHLAIAGCVGNRNDGHRYHPTEKPVGLMEHFVTRCAGTVCDPFMGSASTGVACANHGRGFVGIEIERKYFDIACERIERAYAQQRLFV